MPTSAHIIAPATRASSFPPGSPCTTFHAMREPPTTEALIARAKAAAGAPAPFDEQAREALRRAVAELATDLGDLAPIPRADEPQRAAATALLPRVEALLSRLHALTPAGPSDAELHGELRLAAEALAEAIVSTARGEAAALARIDRARAQARDATQRARPWAPVEKNGQVWDPGAAASRYDGRDGDTATWQLVCPSASCRAPAPYVVSLRRSEQSFTCPRCGRPFDAYLGEAKRLVTETKGALVRYALACVDVDGHERELRFEDASAQRFHVAPADGIVALFGADGALRAIHDLSTGGHLWLVPKAACFVATEVFGPSAPELDGLRAIRDGLLARSEGGLRIVRLYYRLSPEAARRLGGRPVARACVRNLLRPVAYVGRWLPKGPESE